MINVTKTYLPDKKKLDEYIQQIFDSGWLTNNGSLVQSLEKKLCEYLGVEHLVLVSNGTLALQIAYKTLKLSGEVITTPFSFVATTSSLLWENLEPVFVDINSQNFNLDFDKIEEKITEKTSAILPVHVFGNACEVQKLEEIAQKHNLSLIFDAAHAFGAKNKEGKSILSYGNASILSFHSTKIFHTIEGGAIIFRKKEDYERAKLLINFGISDYEKVDEIGINCKMNEFQAAMGLCVLSEMDVINSERKLRWDNYLHFFEDNGKLKLQSHNSVFSNNYAYFPIVFQDEAMMLHVKSKLNSEGINPRRYFYPSLNKLAYLNESEACPISESIAERILCLPLFHDLESRIQNKICQIIVNSI